MELKFEISGRISRPIAEVFEAVVDPRRLSQYFTTGGASARLEAGSTVTWSFSDFPGAFPVNVIAVEPSETIVFEWETGDAEVEDDRFDMTRVTFRFTALEGGRTLVSIAEEGWRETPSGLAASYGNCGGWMQMLCALKAWLEHGINLREGMFEADC